jgi:uncharacterized protein YjbI with pentapeptide repeats
VTETRQGLREVREFAVVGRNALEKSDLTAILRNDKTEFRRIREEDPRAEMDLSGADLAGCDLADLSLAGVTLRNACLRGADCTNTNFRFADLSGADLRDADLDGVNFHQTVLEGAHLERANLGDLDRETRMCLHATSFRRVRWSREQLEAMIGILNENEGWEIRYQLVPKGSPEIASGGEVKPGKGEG